MKRDLRFFIPWFIVATLMLPTLVKADTNWETHRDQFITEFMSISGEENLTEDQKKLVKDLAVCLADEVMIPTMNKFDCKFYQKMGVINSVAICLESMPQTDLDTHNMKMLDCAQLVRDNR